MKKKILMGLGIFFGIVVALIVAVVIYFWPIVRAFNPSLITYSNIKAVYIALTMDDAQKEERLKEIDDNLSEEIKNYVSVEIRDFTEEEKQLIASGEKTKTEIIAQIITEATKPKDEVVEITTEAPPVVNNEQIPNTEKPTEKPTENPPRRKPKHQSQRAKPLTKLLQGI